MDNKPWNQGLSLEQKQLLKHLAATTTRILVDRRDRLETQERMERSMASFSHGIMTPLNGLTLALAALRETDQAPSFKEQSGLEQHDLPSSRGILSTEQRELLSTASCCADALVELHRRKKDSMLTTPINEDSSPIRSWNLSEIVSCLFETLAPIPKKVPVFMEIDSSVPETTIFSRTQDLTVFRVAMSCLSTACARTLRGSILLRVLRHCPNGEDDRIVFECYDYGPHLSDHDAAEFQRGHRDRTMCSEAGHREEHIIHDSSLQGLLFGLQSVEMIHGNYGYRKRVTGGDAPEHDHCYNFNKEGSVFWFSVPFPHLLQQTGGVAPLVCPPASRSKGGEREQRSVSMTPPAAVSIESSTRTAETRNGGRKRSYSLSSPLEGTSYGNANDQMTNSMNMMKLISPKLLQPPKDAGMAKCQEDIRQSDKHCELSRKKQALIIDDALIIRKTLARVLNQMGYEVSLAVDGQDGCEKLKQSLYDLVLCDFLMPIMDGADCVRQYRSWESQNRPGFRQFVMGMSGHASSLDAEQAIESGMDGFYAKPLTPKILNSMLRTEAAREAASILDRYWTESGHVLASTWNCEDETDSFEAKVVSQYSLREDIEMNDVDRSISSAFSRDVAGGCSPAVFSESDLQIKFETVRHCLMATNFEISDSFLRVMQCHGWQIRFADNCLEAMDLMKERNWDAVVIGDTLCSPPAASRVCPADSSWCAAQFVAEFRSWESSNRFNRQRNVFLHCSCYSAPEVGSDLMGGSKASVLIQPPPGFDGASNIDLQWDDFNRLVTQQNSAVQENRYDLFFVKRRRAGSFTN